MQETVGVVDDVGYDWRERLDLVVAMMRAMSTQTDAHSAEIFWLYQTATCGGVPPSLSSVPRSGIATLLYETISGQMPSNLIRALSGVPIGAAVAWIVWSAASATPEGM